MNICELLENSLNTLQSTSGEHEQVNDENKQPEQQAVNQTDNQEQSSNKTSSTNEEENDDEEDYNKMIDFISLTDSPMDYKLTNSISIPTQNESGNDSNNTATNSNNNSVNFSTGYNFINEEDAFDALNPFEKLCKLCENPTPTNIESASKYVLPALEFAASQEDYVRIFFYLKKYCFYSDVLIRSLWLDQIQNVVHFLHQEQQQIEIEFTDDFNMVNQLTLLISDLMPENAYQVKKCASSGLLSIVEKQLVDNRQIEEIIVPCLLSLVKENNEDFHIDCITLFGRLAPLIGRELTTKYFLEPFCRLCNSPVFHTRKTCATYIAEIANIISSEDVETHLLPNFCEFMKDQVWAIRKVCADQFSSFAQTCSRATRETVLTERFTHLLEDHSRWVKISAYKSLGSFIATFARTEAELQNQQNESISEVKSDEPKTSESNENVQSNTNNTSNETAKSDDATPTLTSLLKNINDSNTKSSLYTSTTSLNQQPSTQQTQENLIQQLSMELNQEIVPPILLSYFVTMVDINTQNSLDSEMNYNCAYNFPAIALTLGSKYWKFIKNLYKKLSEDLSWKVRQTLAYSIHELAIILGTENTQNDLVPVFDSYIKDVDEVRMGIVSNLNKFLKVLSIDYRRQYMPKLNDFLKMDNQRNWRFRNELGIQISKFCELYPPDCLAEFVQPVTFTLALDKIAEVRVTAVKALVEVLRQFELKKRQDYRRNFIDDVIRTFANSNKWTFRQLYVVLCEQILSTKAFNDFELFTRDFLPKLLQYRNERVPNIRVLVARVLSTYIINHELFLNGKSALVGELELAIQYFSNDPDSDVRSHFPLKNKDNSSLPSYEELYKTMDTSDHKNQMDISNSSEPMKHDEKMNHDDEEDDDDDEDEIIDKTKINQLKIVNLENEMDDDDEMNEVIDTTQQERESEQKDHDNNSQEKITSTITTNEEIVLH
ncbi:unnamed protein product [Brachionus calyciflorus]|uniref:PPP4R1 n=1 Tax=Brachionus calyciflorus TaxID=104777 RepID=A0A813Y994_9BILA|nr:unnamed protein product [Brachionus calyciflorus]